jgi:large subunit ribosomal protein L9
MLLPKGLVELATDKAIARIELLKKAGEEEKQIRENLIIKNVGELGGIAITIKEKTNEKGHLFAGIHNDELARAIKEQTRIDIEPEFIALEKPIRETGEFTIPVEVDGKKGQFKLIVEGI